MTLAQCSACHSIGVATYLLEHITRKEVVRHTQEALAVAEEVTFLALQHREDVVVEVEVLLVEPLYTVQMHLDRVAVEGWQKFGRDDILVQNNVYLVAIDPLGHLALVRDYKVHLAYERHILGNTSEKVAQSAPISETLLQYGLVGVLFVVALPDRVEAIYISDNYIHTYFVLRQSRFFITTNIGNIFEMYNDGR